ncbi:DUF2752 domain-containing protein [Galbibacter sp. BG1]|uniref:DUF2752 domain-containing protein n=1 Tax=Galbibacter sp. BG1 TaxID=1170699 RepID=UPI00293BC433|nr:DUF2752 domain-containing protein [Galbibacter sp. BG1]
MLPCLNKKLFGFECFGCGLQRSVALLFQGDFIGAFKMYPAIYTLIILFVYLAFNNFIRIKNANRILVFLLLTNVFLILGNYILKFFHH